MNELKHTALNLAIAAGAQNADVLPLAKEFYSWLGGTDDSASTGNEKPATRGRKSNAASAPADTAASEPSSPSDAKPTLVADEERPQTATQNADTAQTPAGSTATPTSDLAAANTATAEPTQEQKDALLAEATKFSQTHGHDALLGALKAVGAERFSAIPFAKYDDFRSAMAGHAAGASALS